MIPASGAPIPCIKPIPCINRTMSRYPTLMVQYSSPQLDAAFAALSDATRRGVLMQLGDPCRLAAGWSQKALSPRPRTNAVSGNQNL